MKRVKKFDLYEHRQEEAFLEEQHANGWMVRSKKRSTYTFEETDPLETEYLIEMVEPGTDPVAWEAYREHLGFTHLFCDRDLHYFYRQKQEERFQKKDASYRETAVQEILIRRVLRAFFFVILCFAVYKMRVPADKTWLRLLLGGVGVLGLVYYALLSLKSFQELRWLEKIRNE